MDLPSPLSTVAQLLPLLLSPFPTCLPPSLLSTTTAQSHHYLASTPTDPHYYQPIQVKQQVTDLLHQLVQGAGWDSLQPLAPLYSIDPDPLSIRSLIRLAPTPLSLILQWDQHLPSSPGLEDRPAWCFLTLDLWTEGDHQQWEESLEQAFNKGADKLQPRTRTTSTTKMKIKTPKSSIKTREEMAEGEGTTPGAYGDAEDFWGGYSDDEEEEGSGSGELEEQEQEEEDVREEEDYWERYGQVQSELAEESGGGLDLTRSLRAERFEPEEEDPNSTSTSTKIIINRSRRSSTIRPAAPVISSPSPSSSSSSLANTTTADSTPHSISTPTFLPTPPSKDIPSTRLDVPLPAKAKGLDPSPLSNGHSLAEGGAVTEDSEAEESLRCALEGVWRLFAGAGAGAGAGAEGGGNSEKKRKRWLRIAEQVMQ